MFSTVGGYHDTCRGYHDTCRGYHDTCRGYHEYRGGVQYHGGTQITKDFSPHGTHDIPHMHHDS